METFHFDNSYVLVFSLHDPCFVSCDRHELLHPEGGIHHDASSPSSFSVPDGEYHGLHWCRYHHHQSHNGCHNGVCHPLQQRRNLNFNVSHNNRFDGPSEFLPPPKGVVGTRAASRGTGGGRGSEGGTEPVAVSTVFDSSQIVLGTDSDPCCHHDRFAKLASVQSVGRIVRTDGPTCGVGPWRLSYSPRAPLHDW